MTIHAREGLITSWLNSLKPKLGFQLFTVLMSVTSEESTNLVILSVMTALADHSSHSWEVQSSGHSWVGLSSRHSWEGLNSSRKGEGLHKLGAHTLVGCHSRMVQGPYRSQVRLQAQRQITQIT